MDKSEHYININDKVNIWSETFGNRSDEAVLFIAGAGANSSFWSERYCNELVKKRFFVIKYDHRDFGYSDKLDFDKQPYDIMDLAKDAITILDSLNGAYPF